MGKEWSAKQCQNELRRDAKGSSGMNTARLLITLCSLHIILAICTTAKVLASPRSLGATVTFGGVHSFLGYNCTNTVSKRLLWEEGGAQRTVILIRYPRGCTAIIRDARGGATQRAFLPGCCCGCFPRARPIDLPLAEIAPEVLSRRTTQYGILSEWTDTESKRLHCYNCTKTVSKRLLWQEGSTLAH